MESQYIYQVFMTKTIAFTPLYMLIYSPWRLGFLFQGHMGELSFVIGYTQLFIIFLALTLFFKKAIKTNDKVLLLFSLISFTVLFFMMLSISEPLWHKIPLINNFQFTYRLLVLECFFVSLTAAIVAKYIKKPHFLIALCFITIFYTILNWGNRGAVPRFNDAYLKKDLLTGLTVTGGVEPTAPRWVDPKKINFAKRPKNHIEVVDGKAEITELSRNSNRHEYLIQSYSKTTFKENTFYFPGWDVEVNNKKHSFTYTNEKFPGVISFTLPKGISKVVVDFTDTPVRAISKLISVITILSLSIFSFFYYLPQINNFRNQILNRLIRFLHNTFNSSKSKKR